MITDIFSQFGTPEQWKTAIIFFLGIIALLILLKVFIKNKLKNIAQKTKNDFDDFLIDSISRIAWPFEIAIAFFFAIKFLNIPGNTSSLIGIATLIVVIIYLTKFVQKLIEYVADKKILKREEQGKKTDASAIRILSNVTKWVIWFIAALFILQNAGVNVSAFVAGAGIAGIAIAFSLQEVLSDLFACFSIYFDKPFEVGDFIIFDNDKSGTVKKIGLKSTRIKSLKGDEMIVSNKKLTESILHNYKKMEKRRVTFEIYVDAKTTIPKLKKGKQIIHNIITREENTEAFRTHLKTFNGNSWTYSVIYYITNSNYGKYLDAQESINLEIKRAFDKEKIKFATDIQKIILKD